MPTAMQSAAAWLGSQLKTHAGRTVSVERGGSAVATPTGWCGMHEHEVTDLEGFDVKAKTYDWEFTAEDLPSGFRFRAGDEVVEMVDSVERRYEVLPIGSEPETEEMDSSGVLIRVHTKRVA